MTLSALSATRISRRPRGSPGRGGASGFSLIEALVGVAILCVVLLGVYQVYEAGQWTFWRAQARADLQEDVRLALERMRRDLRLAGYDPAATGQAPVQNPTGTSLAFIRDAEGAPTSALVQYDWDGTAKTLRRTVRLWTGSGWGAATVTTVATNVESLAFQYFPSAAVPGLTRIRITLQEARALLRQPAQPYQVTTEVFLRNL